MYYLIYSDSGVAGPYHIVDTVFVQTQTQYLHPVTNGNLLTYHYYLTAVFNCPGFNSIPSDTVDNLAPATPAINYISVNSMGGIDFSWQPSTSPETFAYIIYHVSGNMYIPLDTIYGIGNTFYHDVINNPDTGSVVFSVAAMDSCNTVGTFNTQPHGTIYLSAVQDRCNSTITLSWNNYQNWNGGVAIYDIYESTNGAPYVKINTVSGGTTQYIVSAIPDLTSLCYRVIATQTGNLAISMSNRVCINSNVVQPPKYNHVYECSVVNTGVKLGWFADIQADNQEFSILRCNDGQNYNGLVAVPVNIPQTVTVSYTDVSANTNAESYYYKILAVDSCSNSYFPTTCRSMYLGGYSSTNLVNHLYWNRFEMLDAVVDSYRVYRLVGTSQTLLGSISDTTLFTDDISSFAAEQQSICYTVQAVYHFPLINYLKNSYTSNSNVWCASPASHIFCPNTIFPNGNNAVFKPVITFPDFSNYRLIIFNRWGEKIFFSNDLAEGWDGKKNSVPVEQGTYTYSIDFTKASGERVSKQGAVSVIY